MSDTTPEGVTTEGVGTTPPAPPAVSDTYTGLSLEARRLADQGLWSFGVNMGGAFIVLAVKKLGGVDDDLQEASTPGFKKSRADKYLNELLGRS